MSLVSIESNKFTDFTYIDYLILDICGLKQENSTYRNSALTCEVSLGSKIGDLSLARKDHQLQIPLGKGEGNMQLNIYPMTNPKARIGKLLAIK